MVEEKLLFEITNVYLDTLCRKAVRQIQRLPKEAMLSGDDTILKNVWDEVCVQVQYEEFNGWPFVEEMLRLTCTWLIEESPPHIQRILFYAACLENEIEFDYECDFTEFASEILYDKVIEAASKYTNKRIELYLENSY